MKNSFFIDAIFTSSLLVVFIKTDSGAVIEAETRRPRDPQSDG